MTTKTKPVETGANERPRTIVIACQKCGIEWECADDGYSAKYGMPECDLCEDPQIERDEIDYGRTPDGEC
jgi:hypothetical protein